MTEKSYRVKLTMADQFGDTGPQPGAVGRVVQETHIVDEPYELWLAVEFDEFPEYSVHWVAHYMVDKL